jgi:hypothetical protein
MAKSPPKKNSNAKASQIEGQRSMKPADRLFGIEINGERKDLFGSRASAEELLAAVAAEGGTAFIFEHSAVEVEARTREAADHELMRLGFQYYVAARAATWAGLLPVCGNLYHHSIEMFLKSGLARTYSLAELKKKFQHNLPRLWDAFKQQFPASCLGQFDELIEKIERFEEIRLPR